MTAVPFFFVCNSSFCSPFSLQCASIGLLGYIMSLCLNLANLMAYEQQQITQKVQRLHQLNLIHVSTNSISFKQVSSNTFLHWPRTVLFDVLGWSLVNPKVLNFWKFTWKWSGWISDYCSLKPLWSGMGEVVPARTSLTLHPPSPPTVL